MSDFLSQFDKSNYKSNPADKAAPAVSEAIRSEPVITVREAAPMPAIASDIPEVQPGDRNQNVAIQGPVHQVEVDRSFQTKRIIMFAVIAIAVIAVCITGILIFRFANRIDVKPLVGESIGEAQNWAMRNRIELNIIRDFNLEHDKDVVFSQHPEGGKIQRGSMVDVIVSDGPDPDEMIALPEFSAMTAAEMRSWTNANKATNVRIIQEYSDEIPDGQFIRLEFRDNTVDESNYSRRDTLNVYVSRGVEPINQNITIPNFKGKTKEEVEAWAESNKIVMSFEEADSDEVAENRIISQSVAAAQRVAEGHEITVVVSLGKGIAVPDFGTVSRTEAAMSPDLNVEVILRYNMNVAYGRLVSQSVPAGTKLFGDDRKVTVVYSEGVPYIDDLIGRSERDLASYFYEFSSKGANITYTVGYVDSSSPKGTIVESSHSSEFVELTTVVNILVSLGNLPPPTQEPLFPELPPGLQDTPPGLHNEPTDLR